MRTYEVTLTGKTPLLMHADNIEWADQMDAWKNDAKNKKTSKAGDDRSPAFRWLGCLYHDGKVLTIPADCIASCIMGGGAMVPVPGGRGNKTFKSQTQSGLMPGEPHWTLYVNGKTVSAADLFALRSEPSFDKHQEAAAKAGFILYLKRAKIGQSKHVRVRPRFDQWSAVGTLKVWDDQITDGILSEILSYAGQYKGLGDWRPGSIKPGPHGMFEASVKKL